MMLKSKTRRGCRSVGDYGHKAWVGATLNIHSISNEEDDDDYDANHDDYDEVGHETGRGDFGLEWRKGI